MDQWSDSDTALFVKEALSIPEMSSFSHGRGGGAATRWFSNIHKYILFASWVEVIALKLCLQYVAKVSEIKPSYLLLLNCAQCLRHV